jgi:hypothetical protein
MEADNVHNSPVVVEMMIVDVGNFNFVRISHATYLKIFAVYVPPFFHVDATCATYFLAPSTVWSCTVRGSGT